MSDPTTELEALIQLTEAVRAVGWVIFMVGLGFMIVAGFRR